MSDICSQRAAFVRCVRQVLGKNLADVESRHCQDGLFGAVRFVGEGFRHVQADRSIEDVLRRPVKEAGERRLIVVLESPHRAEYAGPVPVPARGSTGIRILKFLDAATTGAFSEGAPSRTGVYDLVLLNAVPYQCSQGITINRPSGPGARDGNIRDQIFATYWRWGSADVSSPGLGAADYQRRLTALLTDDTFVLVCCTKGYGRRPLREDVLEATLSLSDRVRKERIAWRCHPSSVDWRRGTQWRSAKC